jgi:hypothetical protein
MLLAPGLIAPLEAMSPQTGFSKVNCLDWRAKSRCAH